MVDAFENEIDSGVNNVRKPIEQNRTENPDPQNWINDSSTKFVDISTALGHLPTVCLTSEFKWLYNSLLVSISCSFSAKLPLSINSSIPDSTARIARRNKPMGYIVND